MTNKNSELLQVEMRELHYALGDYYAAIQNIRSAIQFLKKSRMHDTVTLERERDYLKEKHKNLTVQHARAQADYYVALAEEAEEALKGEEES